MSVPSIPTCEENAKSTEFNFMDSIRQVIIYSGLSYHEVMQLPADQFLLMRKNYVIEKMNKTEEGRKYLKDCERLKQTEPDMEAIGRRYSMGSKVGDTNG